ncbi:MAG: SOS response-associated peptidase [Candidatus Puniceispirillaceae bacterium]
MAVVIPYHHKAVIQENYSKMCGRFTVTATPHELMSRFGVSVQSNLQPRWNVAPSQLSPIIVANGMTDELVQAKFGLDGVVANKSLINARSETITEKPTFRDAFMAHRCLIVASGWYEWRAPKTPYHIQLADGRVMGFAGLSFLRQKTLHFVIVTSAATGSLAAIHHRTPLVLEASQWPVWLHGNTEQAAQAMGPINSRYFNAYQVAPDVGNVRHDHAGLTAPYVPEETGKGQDKASKSADYKRDPKGPDDAPRHDEPAQAELF